MHNNVSFIGRQNRKGNIQQKGESLHMPREFPSVPAAKKPIKKITGKPFVPDAEETEENPRARSAKLRIAEKI